MLRIPSALTLLALALASPAVAQTEGADAQKKRVQFITMGDLDVTGGTVKVPIAYHSARGREKFARLLRLKHDVLPKLKPTAKDVALR